MLSSLNCIVAHQTYGLDEDIITNVSPRIVRGTTAGDSRFGPNQVERAGSLFEACNSRCQYHYDFARVIYLR